MTDKDLYIKNHNAWIKQNKANQEEIQIEIESNEKLINAIWKRVKALNEQLECVKEFEDHAIKSFNDYIENYTD